MVPGEIHKYHALRNQLRGSTLPSDVRENFIPRKSKKSGRPSRESLSEGLAQDDSRVEEVDDEQIIEDEDAVAAAEAIYFPADLEEERELRNSGAIDSSDDEEEDEETPTAEDLDFIADNDEQEVEQEIQVEDLVSEVEEEVNLSANPVDTSQSSGRTHGRKRRNAPKQTNPAASKRRRR